MVVGGGGREDEGGRSWMPRGMGIGRGDGGLSTANGRMGSGIGMCSHDPESVACVSYEDGGGLKEGGGGRELSRRSGSMGGRLTHELLELVLVRPCEGEGLMGYEDGPLLD